ncbi:MAG TPA: phosphoribosyltransferase [Pyrinomonadaceae bacterium]|nr:phosphoribosyltransferase [Pyrinomonadaceae bacterium]
MSAIFKDRRHAGQVLAEQLSRFAGRDDVVVLALPRGGVPVGFEVARALNAPLDVFVVRKLGVPGQEELAFGAIASGGVRVLNEGIIHTLRLTDAMIERISERERQELLRREHLYRGDRPAPDLTGQTVIVVDDGLATGATMRAAVDAIKLLRAGQIVVAVPVGSRDTCSAMRRISDVLCVCAEMPEPFYGVGLWYEDFSQTTDEEVTELLARRANFGTVGA